jgi:hypothetical protein
VVSQALEMAALVMEWLQGIEVSFVVCWSGYADGRD